MLLRRSVVLLIVGTMLSLGVLAYASPPDPDWISGLWDNGDYDDIILLVTTGVGITDWHTVTAGRPLVVVSELVTAVDNAPRDTHPRLSAPTRAPPTL